LRTSAQIADRIRENYNGTTKEVQKGSKKFTYIPWTAMCDQLDDVFGWDGWSAEVVPGGIHYDPHDKAYAVAINLEVYVWDDFTQTVRTIKRPGIGVDFVKYDGGDSHDAAKGARSDGLVVAARSLGNLFGRFLSAKDDGNGSGSSEEASDAQKQTLRKCHVPENIVRAATKAQASGFFDRIFADKKTGAYKFGRKFTNEEAIAAVWGESAVEASDDLPIPQF
jgi:hypothetical protein